MTKEGKSIPSVIGFDATFSAPKSLSVLWALTGNDGFAECHDVAVSAAVEAIERRASTTRVRSNGSRMYVDSEGLTAAVFRQSTVWSELGDCRRFSRSDQAVHHTGLDVSVDSSDRRRAGGFLSRQGPPTLRWALYEAAKNSSHRRSPDHDFYAAVKARHDGKIAALSVARKLTRRCYHVLRNIDPDQVYAIPT